MGIKNCFCMAFVQWRSCELTWIFSQLLKSWEFSVVEEQCPVECLFFCLVNVIFPLSWKFLSWVNERFVIRVLVDLIFCLETLCCQNSISRRWSLWLRLRRRNRWARSGWSWWRHASSPLPSSAPYHTTRPTAMSGNQNTYTAKQPVMRRRKLNNLSLSEDWAKLILTSK